MKLYTKRHIIISAVASGLLVFVAMKVTNNGTGREREESYISNINIEEEAGRNAQVSKQVSASPSSYTNDEAQNIHVYEAFNEAVVNINTQVTGINWFLEPIVQEGGSGSGSIIDSKGYVITNVHVIDGASKIYISLSDGAQYEATVIGQDKESDIAIIKFTPPAGSVLKTIPFGDSKSLKVGQKVIAIGNPFGLERTMTTGIVSGLGRPIQNSNNTIIRDMIQTDTAINPGNSGGPLLDSSGRMIGINTMIYSSSGNSAGVGFAVPASTASRVAQDLMQYGYVQRGIIQASVVQLNSSISDYARLDISSGVLVSQTSSGGNADKAGIKGGSQAVRYGIRNQIFYIGGDVITSIDGIQVRSLADYFSALESRKPGDVVSVTIHRNKRDSVIKVTLAQKEN